MQTDISEFVLNRLNCIKGNKWLTCEHPTSLKLPPLVLAATHASANVSMALWKSILVYYNITTEVFK